MTDADIKMTKLAIIPTPTTVLNTYSAFHMKGVGLIQSTEAAITGIFGTMIC